MSLKEFNFRDPTYFQDDEFSIYPIMETRFPPPVPQKRFRETPKLDVAAFGAAIHAELKDAVIGYILQIHQQGNLVHTGIWNWAQTPFDEGIAWTENTHMHVASISKFLTAVGLVKLLGRKGISTDEKIINYLPTYWKKGPFIDQITFRNLMTHTSGLPDVTAAVFQNLKSLVGADVYQLPCQSGGWFFSYSNINFGLCRVLIPVLNGDVAKEETFGKRNEEERDEAWDTSTIDHYRNYMKAEVFAPAGIRAATLTPTPGYPNALAYKSPVPDHKGYDSGDCSAKAGPVGWRLSIRDLLDLMGHVRRKNTIITSREAQHVLDNFFGIDPFGCYETPAGRMYCKSGLFRSGEREGHCVAHFLPNATEAAIFVNSPTGQTPLFIIVRDAFLNCLSV